MVGVNTTPEEAEAAADKAEAAAENAQILSRPTRDTGSFWYTILSFILPILGLPAAILFRRHNYIRNYKACRKGLLGFCGLILLIIIIYVLLILITLR